MLVKLKNLQRLILSLLFFAVPVTVGAQQRNNDAAPVAAALKAVIAQMASEGESVSALLVDRRQPVSEQSEVFETAWADSMLNEITRGLPTAIAEDDPVVCPSGRGSPGTCFIRGGEVALAASAPVRRGSEATVTVRILREVPGADPYGGIRWTELSVGLRFERGEWVLDKIDVLVTS